MKRSPGTPPDGAFQAARPQVEAALREAQAELEELKQRQRELEERIRSARMFLGEPLEAGSAERSRTLHEALRDILKERGNAWTEVSELARELNERKTYRRKDGRPLQPSQIHARVHNYLNDWFEKKGSKVRLVERRVKEQIDDKI